MTTTVEAAVKPKKDFVEMVAKMGNPIMDIPNEKIRRLVAMTFVTEFTLDDSVTYESVYNDVMGTMSENVKDVQKQVAEAIAAKQTKTAAELYATLKPLIVNAATALTDGDRPVSFAILFDYRAAQKNPQDGSPMMDADNNPIVAPDIDLKVHWKDTPKRVGGSSDGRVSSGSGRVAGDYQFPDSLDADGTMHKWGSMAAYAKDKHGYDNKNSEHKSPRFFLTEKLGLWDIPQRPDENGCFVATAKVASTNGTAA